MLTTTANDLWAKTASSSSSSSGKSKDGTAQAQDVSPMALASNALHARLRAARVLDVFRTTDFNCLSSKPTSIAALDEALGKVGGSTSSCSKLSSPKREIDKFWLRRVIKLPNADDASAYEGMLHWPQSQSRGSLRNFEPKVAALMTPITMPGPYTHAHGATIHPPRTHPHVHARTCVRRSMISVRCITLA